MTTDTTDVFHVATADDVSLAAKLQEYRHDVANLEAERAKLDQGSTAFLEDDFEIQLERADARLRDRRSSVQALEKESRRRADLAASEAARRKAKRVEAEYDRLRGSLDDAIELRYLLNLRERDTVYRLIAQLEAVEDAYRPQHEAADARIREALDAISKARLGSESWESGRFTERGNALTDHMATLVERVEAEHEAVARPASLRDEHLLGRYLNRRVDVINQWGRVFFDMVCRRSAQG